MKIKKVLITGGLGHIGSYLARGLNMDGDKYLITIVDNFLTSRYCSLFNIEEPITFIENSFDKLEVDFLKQFDVVYHSAAMTDAAGSFKNKAELEEINVKQTKVFIDKCIEAEVPHFIFPSSTSVYGVSTGGTMVREHDDFVNPQSPYAEAKVEIEDYIKSSFIGNLSTLSYTIFRFGTIHGVSPGIRFHTAVNKFCYQAALGLPLTVWKENYEMVRPYLSLIDANNAVSLAIDENHRGEFRNEIYNVLTDNITLKDIITLISLFSPHKIEIDWVNTPLLNQHSYEVDWEKIRKQGFNPVGSIKEDISVTMDVMRNLK